MVGWFLVLGVDFQQDLLQEGLLVVQVVGSLLHLALWAVQLREELLVVRWWAGS